MLDFFMCFVCRATNLSFSYLGRFTILLGLFTARSLVLIGASRPLWCCFACLHEQWPLTPNMRCRLRTRQNGVGTYICVFTLKTRAVPSVFAFETRQTLHCYERTCCRHIPDIWNSMHEHTALIAVVDILVNELISSLLILFLFSRIVWKEAGNVGIGVWNPKGALT